MEGSDKETKLTPLFLKTICQKFDLNTILMLNLQNRNVQGGIGSLGDCGNLLHLNLSHNRVTMLSGIEGCLKLKVLDLSHNKLTTIDALKPCESLERLDLQDNMIKDIKTLERIAPNLNKLTVLYL